MQEEFEIRRNLKFLQYTSIVRRNSGCFMRIGNLSRISKAKSFLPLSATSKTLDASLEIQALTLSQSDKVEA